MRTKILFGKPRRKRPPEELGTDGKIIIGKRAESCGLEGPVASSCKHDNELLGSIEGEELISQMTVCFSRRTLFHGVS